MKDFYSQISEKERLLDAWYLAHREARASDFMLDAVRYGDFGFHRDEYLDFISRSLMDKSYYPKPLRRIDVPKSNYAVRPGSIVSIDDLIVLYSIALLIAPKLDKKLPRFVHSWRVKHGRKKKEELFIKKWKKQIQEAYPFLKSKTISYYIDVFDPWYEAWLFHNTEMVAAYEEGYNFMVVSDIVAYFENIELALLRELLLSNLGAGYQEVVNFLLRMLSHWVWPATNRFEAPRGIPQGNGVSSFLGNFYLFPLDKMFENLSESEDIKCFRYMDDVVIFAKNKFVARDSLLKMNTLLRDMRLNLQGAKTKIIEGDAIEDHFHDGAMERLGPIVDDMKEKIDKEQKGGGSSEKIRNRMKNLYMAELNNLKESVPRDIENSKQSRFYRVMVTAYSTLQDQGMITRVFGQIERNADYKILISAYRYFRKLIKNTKTIPSKILFLLDGEEGAFLDYQKAWFFTILRYTRNYSKHAMKVAQLAIENDKVDLYVREQASIFYGTRNLNQEQQKYVLEKFNEENLPAFKRAWIHGLSQLPRKKLQGIAKKLSLDTAPEVHRLGRMVDGLLNENHLSNKHMNTMFSDFEGKFVHRSLLVDQIWEIDILSKNQHIDVQTTLLNHIQKNAAKVRFPFLRDRLQRIQRRLEAEIRRKQKSE